MLNNLKIYLCKYSTLYVVCPLDEQVKTKPETLLNHITSIKRVNFLKTKIIPSAIKTRYDFNFLEIENLLSQNARNYTHVYINDPMLLRHYKSLFYLSFKHKPKFITHSHFIDNPENPKVPEEVSYWQGQVEAALKSDYNFWQCESSMNVFFESMSKQYRDDVVEQVRSKSEPWDDGYSTTEINTTVNRSSLRFELENDDLKDKIIVFIPNRVGGLGRSFDYTNAGKFLFEMVNRLYEVRQDFAVIAGNPSQKISNDEIAERCHPYLKLIDDTFTRNEYRYVARKAHINVGLYDNDSYGGTAWRECIDLGCLPLSINMYEYKNVFDKTAYPFVVNNDFSNMLSVLSDLIDYAHNDSYSDGDTNRYLEDFSLRDVVVNRCSYECTTLAKMQKIDLC